MSGIERAIRANTPKLTIIVNGIEMKPDDELDPLAEDGEPEAPDVATDPVEDDPEWDHSPVEE